MRADHQADQSPQFFNLTVNIWTTVNTIAPVSAQSLNV